MNLKLVGLMSVALLAGCSNEPQQTTTGVIVHPLPAPQPTQMHPGLYGNEIYKAAKNYGVDENLVKAIIKVESGFDPEAISKSKAVGLMQLKPSTAGRDAYRFKGLYGQPSVHELKDPATNIDLGTAYISILQRQLSGITNPQTLRYATTVAYVNGTSALLRTFSTDPDYAVNRINSLTPEEFYQFVQERHPASQAPRYLWKVNNAYLTMR